MDFDQGHVGRGFGNLGKRMMRGSRGVGRLTKRGLAVGGTVVHSLARIRPHSRNVVDGILRRNMKKIDFSVVRLGASQ